MRVLFTTQPGHGHFRPLLPLARAAREAGHEVHVASSARFGDAIREAGFEPVAAGVEWELTAPGLIGAFPELAEHRGTEAGNRFVIGTIFGERTAVATTNDLIGSGAAAGYDIIVRETLEFGGLLTARTVGIPCAVVQVAARSNFLVNRPAAAEGFARAAAAVGTTIADADDALDRDAVLAFVPPSLQSSAAPLPSTAHSFRPASNGDDGLPAGWSLPRDRTVYMTLGTVFNRSTDAFRRMIDAVADLDANVILALGRGLDPEEVGPTPEHVRVASFVPQSAIVQRSDVVVCHAGFGTVMDALTAGVPMVLTPMTADQPENAERCEAMGVAEVLSYYDVEAVELRASIDRVLSDDRYRQAAQRARVEIEAMPGPPEAVVLLETLG